MKYTAGDCYNENGNEYENEECENEECESPDEEIQPIDAPGHQMPPTPPILTKCTDEMSNDSKGDLDPRGQETAAPKAKQRRYLWTVVGIVMVIVGVGITAFVVVRFATNLIVPGNQSRSHSNANSDATEDSATTASPSSVPSSLPSLVPSAVPTAYQTVSASPTTTPKPSLPPSTMPTLSAAPTTLKTSVPTLSPKPTASPTETRTPSLAPTTSILPTSLLPETFGFYLMGDIPYAPWEETMLQKQMADLTVERQNNTYFTVHVGDMQKPDRTKCKETRYMQIASYLSKGPLPTFVIPGDNDWIDCSDRDVALEYFRNTFTEFEKNWVSVPDDVVRMGVTYHPDNPELFQFSHGGILFISIFLFNTKEKDTTDQWDERIALNIAWVESFLMDAEFQLKYRAVVMFGHCLFSQDTREFFEAMAAMMVNTPRHAIPVVYFHGDGHKWDLGTKIQDQLNWENFIDIQVDQGGHADPILVEVTTRPDIVLEEEHNLQYVQAGGILRIDRRSGRYPASVTGTSD